MRLASDDVAMLFHDADLQRMCGDRRELRSVPSTELAGLKLNTSDERILRLAELLVIGVRPLLLELKTERGNVARLAASVARAIGGAPRRVGVMSFDPRVGGWFARHRPDVRRGLVLSGSDSRFVRYGKMMRARPQFLAVSIDDIGLPWVQAARRRMPVYAWTVRSRDQAERVVALADAGIWEHDGRP